MPAGRNSCRALRRELHEELDIVGQIGARLHHVTHSYPDRTVDLFFYECDFAGEPKPMLGQQIAWVAREELGALPFPEADAQLIKMLAR
jgi:8-oxo-dGTP diphosphatase